MASATNALSYLDPSAYQNIVPSAANPSAGSSSAPSTGIDATDEIKAIESQGDFKAYLSSSMAVALLQPAGSANGTTDSATLIGNMLQQVLGAYQTQTAATASVSTLG